jgi:ribosome-binding protein aMBF1 (putative translation factor)
MPKLKPPSETETELMQAMSELRERLTIERLRKKQRAELARFIERRPLLTKAEVLMVVRAMPSGAKRASKPVVSDNARQASKFAAALTKAREERKLTRMALSKKLGVHNSNIGYWERDGGKPGPALRKKLAKVLGLDVEGLLANGHGAKHGAKEAHI